MIITHPRITGRVYELPSDTRTLDDWERARHLDLSDLCDFELWKERSLVELQIAVEHDQFTLLWLMERDAAIGSEQRRRRGEDQ